MVGLTDVADVTYQVKIGKVTLEVHGLTAQDIFDLAMRFPSVMALLQSGKAALAEKVDGKTLLSQLPDAVYAAMAIATGDPSKAAEKKARSLSASVQLSIINAMMKATLQDGVGPFVVMVSEITALMNLKQTEEVTEVSTTESAGLSPNALTVDLPPRKPRPLRRVS